MIPDSWPRKHPKAIVVDHTMTECSEQWTVNINADVYFVTLSKWDGSILVSRSDELKPIWEHWFGVFAALKRVTTGPESAWRMLVPTESGMRDNLNFYHFVAVVGKEATELSGSNRNVAWENDPWKDEYSGG